MSKDLVNALMQELRNDRMIWATAPCGHEFRLAESILFYHSNPPAEGLEWINAQKAGVTELKRQIAELRKSLTSGFTEKSVQVKLGKTVEKVVPILPGFPYDPHECRGIFEPIDYVVFEGLNHGRVSQIDFLDVKTGSSRLSTVQRSIRDAVEDGKVSVKEVG